ncbi:MAG: c-type cytochrome biogenesis protein CcmI [Rhodobacter sp.]|nr:c-type cytochrome biogenesis protein CcmI [Rhodobacter sp.]
MAFWIAAAGIGLAVTVLLLLALLRGRAGDGPPAAYDLRVYRDQLREVDRDLARGVIAPAEAGRLRTEVARRVLEADRALGDDARTGDDAAPRRITLAMAGLVAAVMLGGVWTYARLGAPGYPDLPIAGRLAASEEVYRTRPSQAGAEAAAAARAPAPGPVDPAFSALMDQLRRALKDRPDDLEGHRLLARNESGLGNYVAAAAAQRRVIAILGDTVSADDHAMLAEMMILGAGGYVSPEAEAEITSALQRDPLNGTATYYAGLMFAQVGRPDRTFSLWAPLLDRSQPDDPWVAPLRAQLMQVASEAGEGNYALPDAADMPPGPDADAVAAAAEMTPEQRQEMVRGMVAQLSDRLATQGGSAGEWARLITAYGVLGETDRARAIWAEAQQLFGDRTADIEVLRAAAAQAGVAE